MADCMNKEQREYIEKIEKDMLESTNMTEQEAIDFAFRCCQRGYGKVKEIRNKAIDEFAKRLKNHLNEFDFWKYGISDGTNYETRNYDHMIDKIAEQMKKGV